MLAAAPVDWREQDVDHGLGCERTEREFPVDLRLAWERSGRLHAQNRELHFARDEQTGRMIIEVRTLDGEVLRTIPPSEMLNVMSGGAL